MHELRAHGVAVGLFQRVDDFLQRGGLETEAHLAQLESGLQVGGGQFMESKLEIGDMLPFRQAQGVELGPLVTTLTIGGDERQHPDLLPLVLRGLGVVGDGRFRAHAHLADAGETLPYRTVGHIVDDVGFAFDARQLVKIVPPLLRNGIGVEKILLVEVFHVGGIAARDMRAAPKQLHGVLLHCVPSSPRSRMTANKLIADGAPMRF